jgi:hypothetical protein
MSLRRSFLCTKRHYAPFVKARQQEIIAAVKQAWTTMGAERTRWRTVVSLAAPSPTVVRLEFIPAQQIIAEVGSASQYISLSGGIDFLGGDLSR